MMIRLLTFIGILCSSTLAVSDDSESATVFVGRHLSYADVPNVQEVACPEDDCIIMDALFEASYGVEQVLRGQLDKGVINFRQFDHYGTPSFFHHEYALIFLANRDDGYYGWKYASIPVQKDKKGDFYFCPPIDDPNEFADVTVPVKLDPPLEVRLDYLTERRIKYFTSTNTYIRKGNSARCNRASTMVSA